MQAARSLIFVYNARSEALPKIESTLSRVAAGGAERCPLLALTFSPIGMKKEWKRFLQETGMPVRFLARDEFTAEFRDIAADFPSAFLKAGSDLFLLLSGEEIRRVVQLDELIGILRQKLASS